MEIQGMRKGDAYPEKASLALAVLDPETGMALVSGNQTLAEGVGSLDFSDRRQFNQDECEHGFAGGPRPVSETERVLTQIQQVYLYARDNEVSTGSAESELDLLSASSRDSTCENPCVLSLTIAVAPLQGTDTSAQVAPKTGSLQYLRKDVFWQEFCAQILVHILQVRPLSEVDDTWRHKRLVCFSLCEASLGAKAFATRALFSKGNMSAEWRQHFALHLSDISLRDKRMFTFVVRETGFRRRRIGTAYVPLRALWRHSERHGAVVELWVPRRPVFDMREMRDVDEIDDVLSAYFACPDEQLITSRGDSRVGFLRVAFSVNRSEHVRRRLLHLRGETGTLREWRKFLENFCSSSVLRAFLSRFRELKVSTELHADSVADFLDSKGSGRAATSHSA
ncbi:MAG: hypothetical protein MHM6MM_007760 [Cercozoa sp. M6MM]